MQERKFLEKVLSGDVVGSKFFQWCVKVAVLALMAYFIRQKMIQGHLSFVEMGVSGLSLWSRSHGPFLAVALLLVMANWTLEAKKWQLLVVPVAAISMAQAIRAVLTGLSLGFVTPRSIGDYAGRILETPVSQGEGLVGAVLFNRLSQSLVTYLGGLAGLIFLYITTSVHEQALWYWLVPFLVAGTFTTCFMLKRGRYQLLRLLANFPVLRAFSHLFAIIGVYTSLQVNGVIFYAFLRYCVFSLQFVLVLWVSGIVLPLPALFAGVAVVFMLKSVIPAFNFLSDLGVREFSALLVFSVYGVPENQLIMASLMVWCLNILLPTLAGGINVLRLRFNPPPC